MSKKHFDAIAQTFANTRPTELGEKRAQWTKTVEAIAYTLATFNDRFDSDRFIKACGE